MAGKGRPKDQTSLYDKYIKGKEEIIKSDCRNGADNRGICRRLGISLTTYKRILKEHPEVNDLLKESKEEADLNVESALYRRAIGYEYEEIVTEVKVEPDGSAQRSVVRKIKKHIAGDTTAQIFWLKNRNPKRWRDVQDISAEVNNKIELEPLTKEELEILEKMTSERKQ